MSAGFCVEAVMSLPDACGMAHQSRAAWPWHWNGQDPVLPNVDAVGTSEAAAEPVFRLRARGTPDLELAFELFQPDESAEHCSVTQRRRIGLVKLAGDDRNDRDLRLVQGSALDRLIGDPGLRSRLGLALSKTDINEGLSPEAKAQLSMLNQEFQAQRLPSDLAIGLTGGAGLSLNALIGLLASRDGVQLPVATWGAGTRRLASLSIAASDHEGHPITLVDEIERGLEPYRQRTLIGSLRAHGAQVFLTTHSAPALAAASDCAVWYVDGRGQIGELGLGTAAHRRRDPEAFLSRLTVVAEGLTEVGFVSRLLERAIGGSLLDHGIWVTDGGGNDMALALLESLASAGLRVGAFADDEGRAPERWRTVQQSLGAIAVRWSATCTEASVIAHVADTRLEAFIADSEGDSGERRRTLADRLGLKSKGFEDIRSSAKDLRQLIIDAATGSTPAECGADKRKAWKRHASHWFKSANGGRELAEKLFSFGAWTSLKPQLLPFVNAVRAAVAMPPVSDVAHD